MRSRSSSSSPGGAQLQWWLIGSSEAVVADSLIERYRRWELEAVSAQGSAKRYYRADARAPCLRLRGPGGWSAGWRQPHAPETHCYRPSRSHAEVPSARRREPRHAASCSRLESASSNKVDRGAPGSPAARGNPSCVRRLGSGALATTVWLPLCGLFATRSSARTPILQSTGCAELLSASDDARRRRPARDRRGCVARGFSSPGRLEPLTFGKVLLLVFERPRP